MRSLSGAHESDDSSPRTRVTRTTRGGRFSTAGTSISADPCEVAAMQAAWPLVPSVGAFRDTRAPSGTGLATLAAGSAIAKTSTSSAESRSETNTTRLPSGETRGCVSLSAVCVRRHRRLPAAIRRPVQR